MSLNDMMIPDPKYGVLHKKQNIPAKAGGDYGHTDGILGRKKVSLP